MQVWKILPKLKESLPICRERDCGQNGSKNGDPHRAALQVEHRLGRAELEILRIRSIDSTGGRAFQFPGLAH
jgi:hypothetical protein